MPARHWSLGLNWMVVSNISSGAGSVAVSARPALPYTLATSGTVLIKRSVCCKSSEALPVERPGKADGMYSRSPSSSFGMNSPPMCCSGHRLTTSAMAANTRVIFGPRRTRLSSGRYAAIRKRFSGLVFSSGMRPRIK